MKCYFHLGMNNIVPSVDKTFIMTVIILVILLIILIIGSLIAPVVVGS